MAEINAVVQSSTLEQNKTIGSVITLANASTIVEHVVMTIVGNDISDSLNGSRLTMDSIRTIAQARFQKHLKL